MSKLRSIVESVGFGNDPLDLVRLSDEARNLSDEDLVGEAELIRTDPDADIGLFESKILGELSRRYAKVSLSEHSLSIEGSPVRELAKRLDVTDSLLSYMATSMEDGAEKDKLEEILDRNETILEKLKPLKDQS